MVHRHAAIRSQVERGVVRGRLNLVGNAHRKRVVCSKLKNLGNNRTFDVPTQ